MSEKMTTLADVCRAANEEGVWADTFDCVVNRAHPKDGNKPSKADVYDMANGTQAKLAWFGGNLQQYEGKVIRIGGKGNKAKLYNGAVEISIGKNGVVSVQADAPKGTTTPPASGTPPSQGGNNSSQGDTPKVDPVTFFHREMAKQSLGYLHCLQYAQDVQTKAPGGMPPEQFQACVSSLYIEGNKRGLFTRVPKLRELDPQGRPVRYVAPAPDPAAEEKARLAREEAERKQKEAEEAQRRAANQHQEDLDQDVPF